MSLGPKLTHFKTYCCARWFSTSCSYLAIRVVKSKNKILFILSTEVDLSIVMDVAPDLKMGNVIPHRCIKDIQICFERPNKSIALVRTYQKLAALMVEWVATEK